MTNLESKATQPTLDTNDAMADVESSIQHGKKDKDDADSELISWWTSEAAQAHKFRHWAFFGGFWASFVLFAVWLLAMLFYWPEHWYSTTVTLAFGVKFSLCTLTFLTVAIATLRFAIRCYGHHQSNTSTSNEIDSPSMSMAGKVLEAVGKALNQQQ